MNKIDKFFQIKARGSTFGREILAGVVVFLAMIYILPTNVGILSGANMDGAAVFMATAIASAVTTLLMGLVARRPIGLSAGMGMNAFFAFTVCGAMGYVWQEALTITLVASLIFLVITITPVRRMIINAIPKSLKSAIIVGLGAFIAFVGLQSIGFVAASGSTLVTLGDLSSPSLLLGIFGILAVVMLLNVKGKVSRFAIPIAMGATALVGLLLGRLGVAGMPEFDFTARGVDTVSQTFGQAFLHFGVLAKPQTYAIIFSFIFVNLFDTTATMLSIGERTGMLNEKGELVDAQAALLIDAGGAVIAGIVGTSPMTSFAETNTGLEMGARTGLTAVVVGLLFALSVFAYPLFSLFTFPAVTGMALVAIGGLMFSHLSEIDWKDPIITFTTFLTVLLMIVCYSISDGLGIGLISYCLMMVAARRWKEVNPVLFVIAGLFIVSYVVGVLVL